MTVADFETRSGILDHVRTIWPDSAVVEEQWEQGPIQKNVPGFRVLRLTSRNMAEVVYITSGCFAASPTEHIRHEFFLLAPAEERRHVEMLTMLANFHADPRYRLDLGSVVAIGDPWLPRSTCDHLLICLPYPYGPKLEWLSRSNVCIRFLWALPITAQEASFERANGLEALEQEFDATQLDYLNPNRASVI